jgi:uncharacterized protein (DUF58 family)
MGAWDLLLAALWALDLKRLPPANALEISRTWTSAPALGTRAEIVLEVWNHGSSWLRVAAIDDVPALLRPRPPTLELLVPARGAASARFSIEPVARGEAKLGRVFLKYQSRLRLAERWAVADLEQQVRIYPNLEEPKRLALYLIRSRQIELERRLKRQRGRGREFESLREYRDGDERRDICWTATARRGKLITKIYQVERNQSVWLVIDSGRLMRARVARLSKLDYAVNAALSLAHVASYSGDRVGVLAYGRAPQQLLGAGRGGAHLRHVIERLALVRGEAAEADHLRAAETLLAVQKGRSLVFWLTDLAETAVTPEVVELAARITPPHLVVFSLIGQPELSDLVARAPEDEHGMYRYVAGAEVVHRRELLLRRLRERGALAIELEPDRMSVALVNQYLAIKERGML